MNVYLDASILVAFCTDQDALSTRAATFLHGTEGMVLAVSDFVAAEVASALGRKVRMGEATVADARAGLAAFDVWAARTAQSVGLERSDIAAAATFLRRLDLNLRTPDALHIAIAQRLDAELATFDLGLTACAHALGARLART